MEPNIQFEKTVWYTDELKISNGPGGDVSYGAG